MKKYLITFFNDSEPFNEIVKADNIQDALNQFKNFNIKHEEIFSIILIC